MEHVILDHPHKLTVFVAESAEVFWFHDFASPHPTAKKPQLLILLAVSGVPDANVYRIRFSMSASCWNEQSPVFVFDGFDFIPADIVGDSAIPRNVESIRHGGLTERSQPPYGAAGSLTDLKPTIVVRALKEMAGFSNLISLMNEGVGQQHEDGIVRDYSLHPSRIAQPCAKVKTCIHSGDVLRFESGGNMAFEVGERVISRFCGPGTVMSEMTKDEDGICFQRVKFDLPMMGDRLYEVRKLSPADES